MTWQTIGQLALPFQLQRHGTQLRTDMARLTQELATGETADTLRHLAGQTGQLAVLEARKDRLGAFVSNLNQTETRADAAQTALSSLNDIVQKLGTDLLTIAASGADDARQQLAAKSSQASLQAGIQTLNQKIAGRALFSGIQPDTPALPDAEALLSEIRTNLGGIDTAEGVVSALEPLFFDAGGVFETNIYQGGELGAGMAIETGEQAGGLPTAADMRVRKALLGLAAGGLIDDPALNLSRDQKQALIKLSSEALLESVHSVTSLKAELGETQAQIETRKTTLQSERASLDQARATLIGKDPYEAATELQSAQTRLEMIYAITARTARLSLTEYLR